MSYFYDPTITQNDVYNACPHNFVSRNSRFFNPTDSRMCCTICGLVVEEPLDNEEENIPPTEEQ